MRTHALHLASGGLIAIHKQITPTGAHRATEYEVIHNVARKRVNENATMPLRSPRSTPKSRIDKYLETEDRKAVDVARTTRDVLGATETDRKRWTWREQRATCPKL